MRRIVPLVLVLLTTTACAGRYNPIPVYLDPRTDASQHPPYQEAEHEPDPSTRDTYAGGVAYADALARAYLKAMARDAQLADIWAVTLLPMGAAGIGLGLAGVTTESFIALGVATATGFGLASWFRNPSLRDAFALGYRALQCVIARSPAGPLVALGELDSVKKFIDQVETDRANLIKAIDAFAPESVPSTQADPGLRGKAAQILENAHTTNALAATSIIEAFRIYNALRTYGTTIARATDQVRGLVTAAAVRGQNDVNTLPELLRATVQTSYQDIFGVLAAEQAKKAKEKAAAAEKKATGEQKDAEERMDTAESSAQKILTARIDRLKILIEALTRLQISLATLETHVAPLNFGGVATDIANCIRPVEIIAARRDNPLVIRPSSVIDLTLAADTQTETTIVVSGGVVSTPNDYQDDLSGPSVGDVTIAREALSGGRQYTLTFESNAKPGRYVLVIRDLAGTQAVVRINVAKKE